MAEPLSAGITRDRAFELLNEHNKDPFHITHGETVEGTMRYFAREFDPRTRSLGHRRSAARPRLGGA